MAGERLGECLAVGVPTPASHAWGPGQGWVGRREAVGTEGEAGGGGLWPELRLC